MDTTHMMSLPLEDLWPVVHRSSLASVSVPILIERIRQSPTSTQHIWLHRVIEEEDVQANDSLLMILGTTCQDHLRQCPCQDVLSVSTQLNFKNPNSQSAQVFIGILRLCPYTSDISSVLRLCIVTMQQCHRLRAHLWLELLLIACDHTVNGHEQVASGKYVEMLLSALPSRVTWESLSSHTAVHSLCSLVQNGALVRIRCPKLAMSLLALALQIQRVSRTKFDYQTHMHTIDAVLKVLEHASALLTRPDDVCRKALELLTEEIIHYYPTIRALVNCAESTQHIIANLCRACLHLQAQTLLVDFILKLPDPVHVCSLPSKSELVDAICEYGSIRMRDEPMDVVQSLISTSTRLSSCTDCMSELHQTILRSRICMTFFSSCGSANFQAPMEFVYNALMRGVLNSEDVPTRDQVVVTVDMLRSKAFYDRRPPPAPDNLFYLPIMSFDCTSLQWYAKKVPSSYILMHAQSCDTFKCFDTLHAAKSVEQLWKHSIVCAHANQILSTGILEHPIAPNILKAIVASKGRNQAIVFTVLSCDRHHLTWTQLSKLLSILRAHFLDHTWSLAKFAPLVLAILLAMVKRCPSKRDNESASTIIEILSRLITIQVDQTVQCAELVLHLLDQGMPTPEEDERDQSVAAATGVLCGKLLSVTSILDLADEQKVFFDLLRKAFVCVVPNSVSDFLMRIDAPPNTILWSLVYKAPRKDIARKVVPFTLYSRSRQPRVMLRSVLEIIHESEIVPVDLHDCLEFLSRHHDELDDIDFTSRTSNKNCANHNWWGKDASAWLYDMHLRVQTHQQTVREWEFNDPIPGTLVDGFDPGPGIRLDHEMAAEAIDS